MYMQVWLLLCCVITLSGGVAETETERPDILEMFVGGCLEEAAERLLFYLQHKAPIEVVLSGGFSGVADEALLALMDLAIVLNQPDELMGVFQHMRELMNETQRIELENQVYQYIYQYTNLQPERLLEWDMFNESVSLTVSTLHEQAVQEADKRFKQSVLPGSSYLLGSLKQQAETCLKLMDWQKGFECYRQHDSENMEDYLFIHEECANDFFNEEIVGQFASGGPFGECMTIPTQPLTDGVGHYDMFAYKSLWISFPYLTPFVIKSMVEEILLGFDDDVEGLPEVDDGDLETILQTIAIEFLWALRLHTPIFVSNRAPHSAVDRGVARGLIYLTRNGSLQDDLSQCQQR